MRIGIASPIPDLGSIPGPSRPGWPGDTGSYDFQFRVEGQDAVVIKANAAGNGSFTIKWPNGNTQVLSGNNPSVTAPDATDGIVSINNENDTDYCDDFAIVGGKGVVREVISWGNNNWSNMAAAFKACTNLTQLPSASNVFKAGSASLNEFIHSCTGLTELDMTGWDLSSGTGTNLYYFAFNCTNLEKIIFKNKDVKLNSSTPRPFQGVGTTVANGCEFDMEGLNFTGTCNDMNTWFITARAKIGSNFSNWRFNQSVNNLSLTSLFNQIKFVDTSAILNVSGWTDCNAVNLSSMFSGAGGASSAAPIDAINITGLRTNDTTTMYRMFRSSKMSRIIGLNDLVSNSLTGNGAVEMFSYTERLLLKNPTVTPTENLSNSFGSNWNITSVSNMFQRLNEQGDNYNEWSYPPNLTGFDLSGVNNYAGFAVYNRLSNPYNLSPVTFPTSAISLQGSLSNQSFPPTSDFTFDFSNVTINVSNLQTTFQNNQCNRYKFGSNFNFSNNTTFQQTFKYSGMPPILSNGNPSYRQIRVEFPTNANFGSVTTMSGMFEGQYGGYSSEVPFTNCQADNFIRIIHGTAFSNNLTVDLLNSQVTEAPSVVQSKLQELTTGSGGWSITVNSTDATMPFVYTGSFLTGANITPTINTSGGAFSSSDVTVDEFTGVFNTSTAGNVTIRYTFPDGCYNEQILNVVPPFTPFKFRVTGPISIKAQPAVAGQSFTIDWGDGSTPVSTTGGTSIASNFTTPGTYDVQINASGDNTYCDEFAIVSGQTNVTKVLDWGETAWSDLNSCFKDCTSLNDISTTKLIAGTSCDQRLMFNGCTSLLEADIKSWDLTAGVNWDYGGPFHELGNLQKLDMTGMIIKLAVHARSFLGSATPSNGIGTNVANGCEFLMSNIDWSTSTATQWQSFFRSARLAPTSTFANWVWPQINTDLGSWTQDVRVAGTDTTIDMSGWTTYYDNEFPRIDFSTISNNDENLKVDFSNLNVSNINDMSICFYYTDVSQILGIETWGATAGNVNMQNAFLGNNFLKFTNSNNFSDTFVQSLTPTTMKNAFFQLGWGLTSNYGVAPNISNIDLSNCTSLQTLFWRTKFTNLPDIQSATFPSSAINMNSTFKEMRIYNSDVHFDLSNVSMKPSTMQQMFTSAWVRKVTFGNNVDFSDVTTVQGLHSYMNQNNPDGTTTELIYPTNADFSSLANSTDWFAGLNGTNANNFVPLSTCQVDNLIRRFRATAYSNALFVNFYESQITEAPSVVRAQQDELVANGWSFDDNTTDATIPFEYTGSLAPNTPITPTNNTGSAFTGEFSSSNSTNIPVVATGPNAGLINSQNGGSTTIRYTLADGCYTEQAIVLNTPVDQISNAEAMSFNGTDAYIAFPATPNTGDISISFWVKYSTGSSTYVASGDGVFRYIRFNSTQSKLSFVYANVNYDLTTDIKDGTWHHVVVTHNQSAATVKGYTDGSLTETHTNKSGGTSNNIQTIGAYKTGTTGYFNGELDEFAVFNTELSASKIQEIYDATAVVNGVPQTANLFTGGLDSSLVYWNRMGDS